MNKISGKAQEIIEKSFTQPAAPTADMIPEGVQDFDISDAGSEVEVVRHFASVIPRQTGLKGTAFAYQMFTKVNVMRNGLGVREGERGAINKVSSRNVLVSPKFFGMDGQYTEEAQLSTKKNLKALSVAQLLQAVQIEEERLLVGGNKSYPLGKASTPVGLVVADSGDLVAGTVKVKCIPLNYRAWSWNRGVDAVDILIEEEVDFPTYKAISKEPGGTGIISNEATFTATAGSAINASVNRIAHAFGYAWIVDDKVHSITDNERVVIKSLPLDTQEVTATQFKTDKSTNELEFDGLLTQLISADVPSVKIDVKGAKLTAIGKEIVQIRDLLNAMYKKNRAIPDVLYINQSVNEKLLEARAGAGLTQVDDGFGAAVKSYKHPVTGQEIPVVVHLDMVSMIYAFKLSNQVPLQGISSSVRLMLRKDYTAREFVSTDRKGEHGVYFDGVLVIDNPTCHGLVYNFE